MRNTKTVLLLLFLVACRDESSYRNAPAILVYFSGPLTFNNQYVVNSYMVSNDNHLTYVQFDSLGKISEFKKNKISTDFDFPSLQLLCTGRGENAQISYDFYKYNATYVALTKNEVILRKDCENGQNLQALWLTNNEQVSTTLDSGKNAKKGKYIRAVPYLGEAKSDIYLNSLQTIEVQQTLTRFPYKFFHISDLPSLAEINNIKGDVLIVRLESNAYAFYWYDF
ncbi:hypothetical protein [Paraglaciecola sp.]|uniref:hypothetical protein n=1 Tax=Paraglaciecola sp. TaxID=1920173 RepID=UPI0032673FAF